MPDPANNEALREEFNRWAEAGRGEGMEEDHLPIALPVLDQMKLAPDDNVLDVGCGAGWLVRMIAERVPEGRVIGMDISCELVELAGQRLQSYGISSAKLLVGSAYETGLPDGSLDVVFSSALLHHLDLPKARAEIYRILRPGGLFILREPIRFSRAMNSLRQLFPAPKADISDFEHPMTRAEVATVTQGFTVVAQRNFRLPFVPLLGRFKGLMVPLWKTDRWLLSHFSGLEHFATGKVMSLRK